MILEQFGLQGKTALVTGAATGLGAAIAAGLAQAGADIIAVHHSSPPLETRAKVESAGRRFTPLAADLGDPASMGDLVARAGQCAACIDILVNNAGIIRRENLLDFSEVDWDAVMNVNLKSMFLLSQQVARRMVDRGKGGKIINVASMLSFQGGIRVASYTASKHGVLGLTRIFANELAPHRINVNAIAPGYMATANTKPLRDDPKRSAEILARIPAARWGEGSDLQGAAVFLASSASDYVHGAVLPVDGGWLSR